MKAILILAIAGAVALSQTSCSTSASMGHHGVSTSAGSGGVSARAY